MVGVAIKMQVTIGVMLIMVEIHLKDLSLEKMVEDEVEAEEEEDLLLALSVVKKAICQENAQTQMLKGVEEEVEVVIDLQ